VNFHRSSAFSRPAALSLKLTAVNNDNLDSIPEYVSDTQIKSEEDMVEHSSPLPPSIYKGSARLLNWSNTARSGMSVELCIRDIAPHDVHPFKGMLCGKENGQRLKIWIGPGADHLLLDHDSKGAFYAGDGLLMRWSDDSVNGMSIKLLIDGSIDGSDGKHPFDGFITGRKEGEVMTFLSWAVSDDETIQDPAFVRKKRPFAELSPVSQSQILCGDNRFISFLAKNEHTLLSTPVSIRPIDNPKLYASEFVKLYIGVESRAEMNYETPEGALARKKWRDLFSYYDNSRGKSG
jgi:hypothetical protein